MFLLEKSKPRKLGKFCPGDSEHFLLEGGVSVSPPYLHIFNSPRSGHLVKSSKVNERGGPGTLRVELGNHPAHRVSLGRPGQGLKEIRQGDHKKWNLFPLLFVFVRWCRSLSAAFRDSSPQAFQDKESETERGEHK